MSGFLYRFFFFILFGSSCFAVQGVTASGSFDYSSFADYSCPPSFLSDSTFHSPKKAALLSAIVPGAGQFYNKKYWKIPLVYAAGAAGGYFISENIRNYKRFRTAYIYRTDEDPNTIDELPGVATQHLKVYRDAYRRDAEFTVILTSLAYFVQILDATVDAHLFDFDVSDKISLSVRPVQGNPMGFYQGPVPALTLHFSLNPACARKTDQLSRCTLCGSGDYKTFGL